MEKLNNVFGFLLDQPLHKSMRQLRVLPTIVLFSSLSLMDRLIIMLEADNAISPETSMGIIAGLATAVFAGIWKGLAVIVEVHKEDD